MFRNFIGKLQNRFSPSVEANDHLSGEDFGEPIAVPGYVKKGHFSVLAVKGIEKKRFVVKIEYLNKPEFIRLLERTEQEYGFEQTGALMLPCTPQELEKILKTL